MKLFKKSGKKGALGVNRSKNVLDLLQLVCKANAWIKEIKHLSKRNEDPSTNGGPQCNTHHARRHLD
eukprot:548751-Amphidinium_carterae.1